MNCVYCGGDSGPYEYCGDWCAQLYWAEQEEKRKTPQLKCEPVPAVPAN